MKIFVINPGSTSTKLALYEDDVCVRHRTVYHPKQDLARFEHVNDQFAYRDKVIRDTLEAHDLPLEFDAVIARGGLLRPIPGGVYKVTDAIKHDLKHSRMEHVSNLGALIADDLAREAGCPAFIADPEVVDELIPEARVTGLPQMKRVSVFHALNSKAVSRHYAASVGKKYEDLNLIVVHLGGGISVSAHRHGKVIDVNNALNGDG
ncbi:MAG: butyrate kinase, partial [Muribaculaceae bacterium]|nr:butyrate kinase [Muribaculaceae bacterium]